MSQKQKTTLILAAIVLLVMLACGYIGYTNSMRPTALSAAVERRSLDTPLATGTKRPAPELSFCYEGVTGLCILSFGRDNAKHLLIIIKNHQPATEEFYISLKQTDQPDELYKCQPVTLSSDTAYCMGKDLPEGTNVTMEVYSKSHRLLAVGVVPIAVIATPTAPPTATTTITATWDPKKPTYTATATRTITPTWVPGRPTLTPAPKTRTPVPTPTRTRRSYPYP
jgi:hypothetical protein